MTNMDDKVQEQSAFCKLDELMAKDYPPTQWLVESLIPEEALVILSAKPSTFKTWLSYEIALKVASGQKLFDELETTQTGVLILDGESGDRLMKNRFACLGYMGDDKPIFYRTYSGGAKFDSEKVTEVIDFCLKNDVKLIIFDSFVRFSGVKDENSSVAVAEVFKQFSEFKTAGLTALFIHHSRKGSAIYGRNEIDSVRGSSDIIASCDVHLALTKRGKNTVIISQPKNRFDEETSPIKAKFRKESPTSSRWHYLGKETPTELDEDSIKESTYNIIRNFPGLNQKQIRDAMLANGLDIGEKRLRSLLRELEVSKAIFSKKGDRTEILYYTYDDGGERQNG